MQATRFDDTCRLSRRLLQHKFRFDPSGPCRALTCGHLQALRHDRDLSSHPIFNIGAMHGRTSLMLAFWK